MLIDAMLFEVKVKLLSWLVHTTATQIPRIYSFLFSIFYFIFLHPKVCSFQQVPLCSHFMHSSSFNVYRQKEKLRSQIYAEICHSVGHIIFRIQMTKQN